jgi:hypothetical protein
VVVGFQPVEVEGAAFKVRPAGVTPVVATLERYKVPAHSAGDRAAQKPKTMKREETRIDWDEGIAIL